MASEVASDGITVNAVCRCDRHSDSDDDHDSSGGRLAASYPIQRLGSPEEEEDLIAFLQP